MSRLIMHQKVRSNAGTPAAGGENAVKVMGPTFPPFPLPPDLYVGMFPGLGIALRARRLFGFYTRILVCVCVSSSCFRMFATVEA